MTKSHPFILLGSCPIVTGIPKLINLSVVEDEFKSEPWTINPHWFNISAIPLMLVPPIPIKCILLYLFKILILANVSSP